MWNAATDDRKKRFVALPPDFIFKEVEIRLLTARMACASLDDMAKWLDLPKSVVGKMVTRLYNRTGNHNMTHLMTLGFRTGRIKLRVEWEQPFEPLTLVETLLLQLAGEGLTHEQMVLHLSRADLGNSKSVVTACFTRILRKLDVPTRQQAVVKGLVLGIVK
jgi:hypothetical protein